ncbi:Flp pilus assembly complex ATPase component TadA [Bifidobacterium sp. 64T4]|uniref:CpaF family protein n=1 Tax=Bifidobacterium pongonis TaxID=2834432 RepID=UPI001C5818D8|nr:ATPase, T2SS/T4P/T4SS family [Bifidobacterium pongonis]MBW3093786.1 Flp pilus assembly complex ATPase component TadA [Bifidobacterium pongonis]MBW3093925.1 Flp pilus assembly complex ATPase component TadA [Bifidobacterium pongonis]
MVCLELGPLENVAADPTITDMTITCDGRVWVDRGNGMEEHHPHFPLRSPSVVREYAVRLCAQLGRRLDDARPIADASDERGVRVHAVIAPLVPQGASVSIRFPSRSAPTLDGLCRTGMFPEPWIGLLHGLVRNRATILITGGTGSGKTTLMKALLNEVDARERIVTVEEVRELDGIAPPNHVALATREANVEGAGAVGLPDLVKATLRMRPDRIVLGECRGEEIADLLRAYNSGHRGGMTTLHADGVERIPARLVSLGMLAGLNPGAVAMLTEGAFDVVMHLDRSGGRRHIAQLGLLRGPGGNTSGNGPPIGPGNANGLSGIASGGIPANGISGVTLAVWDGYGRPFLSPHWQGFVERWAAPGNTGNAGNP